MNGFSVNNCINLFCSLLLIFNHLKKKLTIKNIAEIDIDEYILYINLEFVYFPNGQWLRRELEMLIIDDTLLPLIAVLMLLDELARLRKFRSFGDLSSVSSLLFAPE